MCDLFGVILGFIRVGLDSGSGLVMVFSVSFLV